MNCLLEYVQIYFNHRDPIRLIRKFFFETEAPNNDGFEQDVLTDHFVACVLLSGTRPWATSVEGNMYKQTKDSRDLWTNIGIKAWISNHIATKGWYVV